MIPFKGRSSLKQYMLKKPVRRGSKVWMQAEAVNGYVSGFEVYTGKKLDLVEKGLGATVVKTFSDDMHSYFDNFFSSVDLLLDLFRVGLYGCGTLRSNRRGFPEVLKPHVKKGFRDRGESKTVMHNDSNLTVSVWQDNRPVVVIASNSDPAVSTSVTGKNKTEQAKPYPVQVQLHCTISTWEVWTAMTSFGVTTMSVSKKENTINIFSSSCSMLHVPTRTF